MFGFEEAPSTPAVMGGVATERDARPDGGPETERVEVEPVATFPVYYAWHPDDKVRPFLVVAENGPSEWDELFGPEVAYRIIGFAPKPDILCVTALDYEAAARDAFGDADPWGHGRPCSVQCVDLYINERLIGEVAACVWTWPALRAPWVTGEASVENVAATIGRHPRDVADVFERFNVGGADAPWCR